MSLSNPVRQLTLLAVVSGLLWSSASVAQPQISQQFDPLSIAPSAISTLSFILQNDERAALNQLGFDNTLPNGVVVAQIPQIKSDCGGIVVAKAGSNQIRLSDGRLLAGQSCTISLNVTANLAGSGLSVSSELTSSAGRYAASSANIIVEPQRPTLSQSFEPSAITLSQVSQLTLTLANHATRTDATNVLIRETLAQGLVIAEDIAATTDCQGGELLAEAGTGQFTYRNGTIVAGAECQINIPVMALYGGEFDSVSDSLLSSHGVSGKAGAALTVVAPLISLSKLFDSETAIPGESIMMDVRIDNLSREQAATQIEFFENLDQILPGLLATGLPVADICGEGSLLSGQSQISLSNAVLAAGSSCRFTLNLSVPATVEPGLYRSSDNVITADIGDRSASEIPLTNAVSVMVAPVLSKTFPQAVIAAGQITTLNYQISNDDLNNAASEIAFDDLLGRDLPGISMIQLPADGFCGVGAVLRQSISTLPLEAIQLSMEGATLEAGQSCSFEVQLRVPSDTPNGALTSTSENLTAMIDSQTVTGGIASGSTLIVTGPEVGLSFLTNPSISGDPVTMRVRLESDENAPDIINNVSFTLNLDSVISGMTASNLPLNNICGPGSVINGGAVLTLDGALLAPNTSCEFDVILEIPPTALPGSYEFSIEQVQANVLGLAVVGGHALELLDLATLGLAISFEEAHPGEQVELSFEVSNLSQTESAQSLSFSQDLSTTLSGLVVVDGLESNICGTGSSLTQSGSVLSFNGGTLNAGEQCTFSVTVQIPRETALGEYNYRIDRLQGQIGSLPFNTIGAQANLNVIFKQGIFSAGFEAE